MNEAQSYWNPTGRVDHLNPNSISITGGISGSAFVLGISQRTFHQWKPRKKGCADAMAILGFDMSFYANLAFTWSRWKGSILESWQVPYSYCTHRPLGVQRHDVKAAIPVTSPMEWRKNLRFSPWSGAWKPPGQAHIRLLTLQLLNRCESEVDEGLQGRKERLAFLGGNVLKDATLKRVNVHIDVTKDHGLFVVWNMIYIHGG